MALQRAQPFALAFLFASAFSSAQQPNVPTPATPAAQAPATPANTITRNVSLVVLDGVVLDKKGNVVTDLKREDFSVTEDDQPQQIRNFEVPGATVPPPSVTIDSTADLHRLAPRAPVNIVLLDEFNTRFEDMAFARYSLKKWLEKQPAKLDTPTMLVAVDLQHFTVLRDYTQNKEEILTALDHHFAAYPWQTHNFTWVAERYSTAFNTLRRVAEATVGHLGHKNMIWLGRGFPTINLARVPIDGQNQINSAVQRTVNELRDARVTLYTIDPAGVTTNPGAYGSYAGAFAPFGGDPDFQSLARATGGRNLFGRNDVDAEIGNSIRDGASLYTLTYRPTNASYEPQKFRRIKVTLERPGLVFVTRQGYYPSFGAARPNAKGEVGRTLATELVNAGTSNMDYDAVAFTVKSSPTDANDLRFTVEGRGLPWYVVPDGSKPRFTRLIVLSTVFDKKGKELKRNAIRLSFSAPPNAPTTGRINLPLGFNYKIPAEPKAVRARLVVRIEANGRMGTADLELAPGAAAKSSSAQDSVTPPTVPAPSPSTATPVDSPPPASPAPAASPAPPSAP